MNDSGAIHHLISWGDYDADYKTRLATHNGILVLESAPEIHAQL